MSLKVLIYFTDVFDVDPDEVEAYGAFNVSTINDLPLFIDPLLLFNSELLQTYIDALSSKSLNLVQYPVRCRSEVPILENVRCGVELSTLLFPRIGGFAGAPDLPAKEIRFELEKPCGEPPRPGGGKNDSAKSEERIFVVFLLVSPSERPDVAKLVEICDVHDRKRESPHLSAQASELVLLEPPMWL